MKKLSLLLIIPLSLLAACQAENTAETSTDASPISPVTATTTPSEITATAVSPVSADTTTSAPAVVDTDAGESLHSENCTRCHGSDVYTRADRKVTSLAALGKQVRMCDSQLETQLFPEELEKITGYLNQTYYKF